MILAKPWSRKDPPGAVRPLRQQPGIRHGDNLLEVESPEQFFKHYSNANMRFQSFFMLMTVQLFFFASS
jgi:hypothetical protein